MVCNKDYVQIISKNTMGLIEEEEPVRVVFQMDYFRQVISEMFPGVLTDKIDLVFRTGDFVVFN